MSTFCMQRKVIQVYDAFTILDLYNILMFRRHKSVTNNPKQHIKQKFLKTATTGSNDLFYKARNITAIFGF